MGIACSLYPFLGQIFVKSPCDLSIRERKQTKETYPCQINFFSSKTNKQKSLNSSIDYLVIIV